LADNENDAIFIKCSCGEEVVWNYWLAHTRKQPEKTHKQVMFINRETGEIANSYKEAYELAWLPPHPGRPSKAQEYAKMVKENAAKTAELPSRASTIRGTVLPTDVIIHPYVYELMAQAMSFFPEAYPRDDQASFSRFLLHCALFMRYVTKEMLPWGDGLAESIKIFDDDLRPDPPEETEDAEENDSETGGEEETTEEERE
jgi:hypothetical protein